MTFDFTKYGRPEWERRFRVRRLEEDILAGAEILQIDDVYLPYGRLRLRRMTPQLGPAVYKITQKLPMYQDGSNGQMLTTIYVEGHAFQEMITALKGYSLQKRRHRLRDPNRGLVVDIFAGALDGLVLAEIEFDSADAMRIFIPPAWCAEEVTNDARFRGFDLARDGRPS